MLDTPATLLHRLCDHPVPDDWERFVRLFTPLLRRWAARFGVSDNITSLNLFSTQVSDAGLARFQDCKNLTSRNLGRTQVTDAGLERLVGCAKLIYVTVKNTKVTEAGVKKLSVALPGCKIEWDGGVVEDSQK